MSNIKLIAKKVLRHNGIEKLKQIRSWVWHINVRLKKIQGKYVVNKDAINKMKTFSLPGKHVFFGYYDLPQISKKEDKIIFHTIDIHSKEGKDSVDIEWIDLHTNEKHVVTQSQAWCWQQGSRLRWHPTHEDIIMFNNSDGLRYCSELWDIRQQVKVDEIPYAIYDVDNNFTYGLSLNFSRLQRFRPGYGYCNIADPTIEEHAPADDGVFLIDLQKKTSRLIISIKELSEKIENGENKWHYINHLSFSKTGQRFMFFHIWTSGAGMDWSLRLYTANTDGTALMYVDTKEIFSHYCWKNDTELLLSTMGEGNTYVYSLYDTVNGNRKVMESQYLKKDGHPSYIYGQNRFITDISDLSKLKNCMQSLYVINEDGSNYASLLSIFSDPRMSGDRRCDLHPRITPSGKIITVDSTCFDGKRSVILLEVKENH